VDCQRCVRVCHTAAIHPDRSFAASPSECTACLDCVEVCPTGAIPELPLEEKRRIVIGIARIDEKRCIPFAENRDCLVCEEMCPVSDKAIKLEAEPVINSSGQLITVRRPAVINDRCIGCGICETKCPVKGESAIIIHPAKRTD